MSRQLQRSLGYAAPLAASLGMRNKWSNRVAPARNRGREKSSALELPSAESAPSQQSLVAIRLAHHLIHRAISPDVTGQADGAAVPKKIADLCVSQQHMFLLGEPSGVELLECGRRDGAVRMTPRRSWTVHGPATRFCQVGPFA